MTKKDLLDFLEDLSDKEFEDFKWHLKDEKVGDIPPIKVNKLSEAKMRDVVDLMVQKYKFARAVDVFKSILEKISRNDLVGKLPNISSGAEGQSQEETNMTSHPNSSSVRRNSPDKKTIFVLGTADYLKNSLISLIRGRGAFPHGDTHESHTHEVIYTPNLYTASEGIKELFSLKHPDMCLLVVKDGISPEEVQQQIEKLHKTTGKPREEFIVVLPLSCKTRDDYPANYILGELFNKLAEDTQMMPPNKRQKVSDKAESSSLTPRRV